MDLEKDIRAQERHCGTARGVSEDYVKLVKDVGGL